MRTRHKIPTIFNLSMVDVLCCALGCVILLWLLNLREAKRQTAENAKSEKLLAAARAELTRTGTDLAGARKERDDLTAQAGELKTRLDETARQVRDTTAKLQVASAQAEQARKEGDQARARVAELEGAVASLQTEQRSANDRLVKQSFAYEELMRKLSTANQRVLALGQQLREKENLALASERHVDELAAQLGAAEAQIKQLRKLADQVPELRNDLKTYRSKYATEEALASALQLEIEQRSKDLAMAEKKLEELQGLRRDLERELASRDQDLAQAKGYRDKLTVAQDKLDKLQKDTDQALDLALRTIGALQKEKSAVILESERVRVAAENRFAGIQLTGRRVVFLVDMSGSMELVDENTPAPAKWSGVRETVTKIIRSLPDLEKFQVILFSDHTRYPLGEAGQWLTFDPKASEERIHKALSAIKPDGGTNMYSALDAAFHYRASGLDTIYLLSDGLPNMGEGLTAEASRRLSDIDRCDILSKHIRKTLNKDWNRALPNKPKVRINTIGFFYESPDVGAFLWALARENDGSFVGMSKP